MSSNKLTRPQRQCVKEWLMAGASNAEVREQLAQAGYTGTLADSTLSGYRNDPAVTEAIARANTRLRQEAEETSFQQRKRQLEALDELAGGVFVRLRNQFVALDEADLGRRKVSVSLSDLQTGAQLFMSTLREIRSLLKESEEDKPPIDLAALRAELSVSLRRELRIEVAHEFLDRIERSFGLASTRPDAVPEAAAVESVTAGEPEETVGHPTDSCWEDEETSAEETGGVAPPV